MDLKVIFQKYSATFEQIQTYQDLVKVVQKRFKYILPKTFVLTYTDEEGDKISLTTTDDLIAMVQWTDCTITIEEREDDSGAESEGSSCELKRSVKEEFEKLQNLSSSIIEKARLGYKLVESLNDTKRIQEDLQEIQDKITDVNLKLQESQVQEKLVLNPLALDLNDIFDQINQHEAALQSNQTQTPLIKVQKENKSMILDLQRQFKETISNRFKLIEKQTEKQLQVDKYQGQLRKKLSKLQKTEQALIKSLVDIEETKANQQKQALEEELDAQFKAETKVKRKIAKSLKNAVQQVEEPKIFVNQVQAEPQEMPKIVAQNLSILERAKRIGNIVPMMQDTAELYSLINVNEDLSDDEIIIALLDQLNL